MVENTNALKTMERLTIQVEDPKVMSGLKKVLRSMNGVTILPERKKRTGLEEALDDVKHGRVTEYESVDELFEKLGI